MVLTPPPDDADTEKTTLYLEVEIKKWLQALSKRNRRSMSASANLLFADAMAEEMRRATTPRRDADQPPTAGLASLLP